MARDPNYTLTPDSAKLLAEVVRDWRTTGSSAPQQGRQLGPPVHWIGPFLAEIVAAGPKGEADYTDQRYWIKIHDAANTDGSPTAALTTAAIPAADPRFIHTTATNLSEPGGAEHRLVAGRTVLVFSCFDRSNPAVRRWYLAAEPRVIVAKLIGVLGAGLYSAYEQVWDGGWINRPGTDIIGVGRIGGYVELDLAGQPLVIATSLGGQWNFASEPPKVSDAGATADVDFTFQVGAEGGCTLRFVNGRMTKWYDEHGFWHPP